MIKMQMRQSRAATLLLAQTRPKATMILRDTTALPMSPSPAQRTSRAHPFQCERASSCLQPYLQQNSSARHSRRICAIQTANNAKLRVMVCPCPTVKLLLALQQWIPNAACESARRWSSLPRQPQIYSTQMAGVPACLGSSGRRSRLLQVLSNDRCFHVKEVTCGTQLSKTKAEVGVRSTLLHVSR